MSDALATIVRVRCKQCGKPCELAGCPCAVDYPKITDTNRDTVVKRIKAALVTRSGKQWSVRGDRGTAWGWIRISVPKARLGCARLHTLDYQTYACTTCGQHRNGVHYIDGRFEAMTEDCPSHACDDTCYRNYITPEDRIELARLLGLESAHMQGVSIPASTGHYIEYIDRAEGRTPRKYGEQYWD